MVITTPITDRLDAPILIGGMTWREFKATEQLLDRPDEKCLLFPQN